MMNEVRDVLQLFTDKVKDVFGSELVKVIVYGSYARGDFGKHSDIDVMVLTTLPEDALREKESQLYDVAFDMQMDYLVDISVMAVNIDSFHYWLGAFPFYDNVSKEGIVIAG